MFHPSIETLLILNYIFLLFIFIALYFSTKLFLQWDRSVNNELQYNNQKKSFLVATIIKYLLFFKIPLFLFFIFTLDKLSLNFIGAMCAAGVVDNLDFGINLLIFKIVNLFLLGFWIILHQKDIKTEYLEYSKIKFGYFIIVGIFIFIEIILEIYTLSSIDTNQIVQCCGTIFSKSSTTLLGVLFVIDSKIYAGLFYLVFLLLLITYILNKRLLFSLLGVVFLVVAIISLILFFGIYIYELPTHHCPFCFLQKEYNYVGYLLYFLLFLGSFFAISSELENYMKRALLLLSFYMILVSYYVVSYYIRNGVLFE